MLRVLPGTKFRRNHVICAPTLHGQPNTDDPFAADAEEPQKDPEAPTQVGARPANSRIDLIWPPRGRNRERICLSVSVHANKFANTRTLDPRRLRRPGHAAAIRCAGRRAGKSRARRRDPPRNGRTDCVSAPAPVAFADPLRILRVTASASS